MHHVDRERPEAQRCPAIEWDIDPGDADLLLFAQKELAKEIRPRQQVSIIRMKVKRDLILLNDRHGGSEVIGVTVSAEDRVNAQVTLRYMEVDSLEAVTWVEDHGITMPRHHVAILLERTVHDPM
jgi:hypothetical protein